MKIRFNAEWEPVAAVMMALPEADTDWEYILPEALDQYIRIVKALTESNVKILLLCRNTERARSIFKDIAPEDKVCFIQAEYNDTWTRDYGPLCVEKDSGPRILDFGFNAWGMKFAADKDNLVNLGLADRHIFTKSLYRNKREFILEGGSVESDGKGTVLTTSRCLCSPNRNGGKSKYMISEELRNHLGADHVLWLDHGALEGDDTDSHIDTLARIAPENTIIFTGCRDFDDPQFEELLKMRAQLELFRTAEGEPYNLVELPLPDPVYDPDDGSRLPATYCNYLILNDTIFMPTYASPAKDLLACQTVKIAFPNHKVVGVDCRTLLRQHGSLHCATMQLPEFAIDQVI